MRGIRGGRPDWEWWEMGQSCLCSGLNGLDTHRGGCGCEQYRVINAKPGVLRESGVSPLGKAGVFTMCTRTLGVSSLPRVQGIQS